MNLSKKEAFNCEIGKVWSHSIDLMRLLKKDDDLYLDELYLLATIQEVCIETGKPCNLQRMTERFNILSYRRDKMLNNLIKRGLVNNDMEGVRQHYNPHKYVLTSLGDQLLIKYKKAMERLCNAD